MSVYSKLGSIGLENYYHTGFSYIENSEDFINDCNAISDLVGEEYTAAQDAIIDKYSSELIKDIGCKVYNELTSSIASNTVAIELTSSIASNTVAIDFLKGFLLRCAEDHASLDDTGIEELLGSN